MTKKNAPPIIGKKRPCIAMKKQLKFGTDDLERDLLFSPSSLD